MNEVTFKYQTTVGIKKTIMNSLSIEGKAWILRQLGNVMGTDLPCLGVWSDSNPHLTTTIFSDGKTFTYIPKECVETNLLMWMARIIYNEKVAPKYDKLFTICEVTVEAILYSDGNEKSLFKFDLI